MIDIASDFLVMAAKITGNLVIGAESVKLVEEFCTKRLAGKSAALAGPVWDKRIGGAPGAATAMIKMVPPAGEPAGQRESTIGLATTGYLDYSAANART